MESTKLSNIDLRHTKAQISSRQVVEEEKAIIISGKNRRLRSIFVDKFGDHLHGIQQKRYVGGLESLH